MRLLFLLVLISGFPIAGLAQPAPHPATGKIIRHENFPSRFVAARNVEVWLPEGYSSKKQYAVLYMHDGQMLFDSTTTWNGQEWGVDETMGRLLAAKKIRDCIVVGVWNTGNYRHAEYFPQKPFESIPAHKKREMVAANTWLKENPLVAEGPQADNYLRFLVQELKPFIDSTYSTRKGRKSTFIAGSSMGGLISLYAICEYPSVFGGAACLSTHWPGIFTMENNPVPAAFFDYMATHLPDPKRHKIYFDLGTATLDADYPPLQQRADAIMKARGFTRKNWITRVFPGEEHSERAWRKRLETPVLFLLD